MPSEREIQCVSCIRTAGLHRLFEWVCVCVGVCMHTCGKTETDSCTKLILQALPFTAKLRPRLACGDCWAAMQWERRVFNK